MIDSRKRRGKGDASSQADDQSIIASTSLFEEKAQPKVKAQTRTPRLTHAQLKELETQKEKEVTRGYQRVKELWSGMLTGEPGAEKEWSIEAEKLVETFRETRNLFLTSRVTFFFLWTFGVLSNPNFLDPSIPWDVPQETRKTAS